MHRKYFYSSCCNELGEKGHIYFNARYYDPEVGRFLTEDPSRKGTSWYTYCSNNPLTFVDPTGRREIIDGEEDEKEDRKANRQRTWQRFKERIREVFSRSGSSDSSTDTDEIPTSDTEAIRPQLQCPTGRPICDIQAWNFEVLEGLNPNSVLGRNVNPDLNRLSVPEQFEMIPESSKYKYPPANTSGFSYWPRKNPRHVESYTRGSGKTYELLRTTGEGPVWSETRDITSMRTYDRIWVPLKRIESVPNEPQW